MSGHTGSAPLRHRSWALTAVLGIAVVMAAGGLSSSLWIKSPQQVAADARPPGATVLTAPVERKLLRDTVVLRGDVRAARSVEVTPSARATGSPVVTGVPVKTGDTVAPGTMVLEVAGRPLFVLPGAVPAFRDLKPGSNGKDVAQLQAALNTLGFDPGEHTGEFGAGTKRALAAFYQAKGYSALPVSDGDARQTAEADKAIIAAARQVADAQEALDRVNQDAITSPAQRSTAAKALQRAQQDLDATRKNRAELETTTGPMLPQGEYTFLPAFPARVDALKAVIGSPAGAPAITLSGGGLIVIAKLTAAQQALCKAGAAVDVTTDSGVGYKATITSIGELEASGGPDKGAAGPSGYPMIVTPSGQLDAKLTAQSVRLSVETANSGTAQLVVPISALYASADGHTYVTKHVPDGQDAAVAVEPGMSAQGYVTVKVISGGLDVGDKVTVGIGSSR